MGHMKIAKDRVRCYKSQGITANLYLILVVRPSRTQHVTLLYYALPTANDSDRLGTEVTRYSLCAMSLGV